MNSLYAEAHILAEKVFRLNHEGKVGQDRLTQEECIETAVACLGLAKSINKHERGNISTDELVEEIIDIFASGYASLRGLGVTDHYILSRMVYKYKRAIRRIENHNELDI